MSIKLYLSLTLFLSVVIIFYIRLAKLLNLLDFPNERSSHDTKTITGAGIIIPISITIWYFFNSLYQYFFVGLFILTICSIIDDLVNLKVFIRLFIQILSVLFLLININFYNYHIIVLVLFFVITVGWLNCFNFMDGINGIMGAYSLIILSTFYYLNLQNSFINNSILIFTIIPTILFMIFNFRTTAVVFSGNSGTMSMAYILSLVMMKLIFFNSDWTYLIFFSLYGIDASLTIFERLNLRENIFNPHRRHLYQVLVDNFPFNHLQISILYSITQLIINVIYLSNYKIEDNIHNTLIFLIIIFPLVGFYYALKYIIIPSKLNKA